MLCVLVSSAQNKLTKSFEMRGEKCDEKREVALCLLLLLLAFESTPTLTG